MMRLHVWLFFFFSSRRRHTRFSRDWSSDVCSSDLHLDRFYPILQDGVPEDRVEAIEMIPVTLTRDDDDLFVGLRRHLRGHGVEGLEHLRIGERSGPSFGEQSRGKGREPFLPRGIVDGPHVEEKPKIDNRG